MQDYINKSVIIDPSSNHYYQNKLFNIDNTVLNRDGTLLPFYRLKLSLLDRNISINTVDLLLSGEVSGGVHNYYSLGILNNISNLKGRADIIFKAFVIMEPPVVAPELYLALPELTSVFENVYVHNTVGDGYSLIGVDQSRLRKLYWPQPSLGVVEPYFSNLNRLNKIAVINGNHKPKKYHAELYSKRIDAMVALSKLGVVDLYGRGWERWWSRSSLWKPYWLNRKRLMEIYRGECISKYKTLSHYRFCLCFENMEMRGYVTEKIFDCLYVGTIPIYLGALDIDKLFPSDCYIDARKYESMELLWIYLSKFTIEDENRMRRAGELFLKSEVFLNYFDSLSFIG
jgi:hypothetical protein